MAKVSAQLMAAAANPTPVRATKRSEDPELRIKSSRADSARAIPAGKPMAAISG